MGQEYWLRFEKSINNKVKKYLKDRNFPIDENDKSTIIIASEKGKVDAWLSWKGQRLEIASQIFNDQSAWCAAITNRLIELFGYDRVGADSTGWWKKGTQPGKPFEFDITGLQTNDKFKEMVTQYKKLQKLFLAEAKRLLPNQSVGCNQS